MDKYKYLRLIFCNESISIKPPECNYNVNYKNFDIGICGDSFINHNGDKIDIEFYVKQLDSNTELQSIQLLEKLYKENYKKIHCITI